MIRLPSAQEMAELETFNELYCLSIYAPFIEPNSASNPNRIELKNLLREAKIALEGANLPLKTIKKTLAPASELLKNREFWPIHNAGLALFMHPKLFRYYYVPDHQLPYKISLARGFNLDPLTKILRRNKRYFVLALCHKNVKIYEGDKFSLQEVSIKGWPSNIKEALRIDEYPKWTETHSIAPASRGAHSEASHGQYSPKQVDKSELLQFFRLIARSLHGKLHGKRHPLVLAGVNYLIPIYRRANTYQYLLEESIGGNPEHITRQELLDKAWQIVKRAKPQEKPMRRKAKMVWQAYQ